MALSGLSGQSDKPASARCEPNRQLVVPPHVRARCRYRRREPRRPRRADLYAWLSRYAYLKRLQVTPPSLVRAVAPTSTCVSIGASVPTTTQCMEVAHEMCERAVTSLGRLDVCHDEPPFDVRSTSNEVGPSAMPTHLVIEAHEITPPVPFTALYFQVVPPLLDLRMIPPRLLLLPRAKHVDAAGHAIAFALVTSEGRRVADQLNPPLIVRTSTDRLADCEPIPSHTIALEQERSATRATDPGRE